MVEKLAHLAVLALGQADPEPGIGAGPAFQLGGDRPIADAIQGLALGKRRQGRFVHPAMDADPVAPHPAGGGQFQGARQRPVIGQKQEPLGIEIESPDGDGAGHAGRQVVEDGQPPLGIPGGGYAALLLVVAPKAHRLGSGQRGAVDGDDVLGPDVERRRGDGDAVDHYPAGDDQLFRVAPGTDARPGDAPGDALGRGSLGRFPALVRPGHVSPRPPR
jgi:hypothetical protein